jgi:hypothetical protein
VVAADLLERATALMELADPGRDRLLAERASSLMLAGRIADATAACRLLLGRDHDRSVTGPVRICLGHVSGCLRHLVEGAQETEPAGKAKLLVFPAPRRGPGTGDHPEPACGRGNGIEGNKNLHPVIVTRVPSGNIGQLADVGAAAPTAR